MKNIQCPFCTEDDFDLYGFQQHLMRYDCDVYTKVNSDNSVGKIVITHCGPVDEQDMGSIGFRAAAGEKHE